MKLYPLDKAVIAVGLVGWGVLLTVLISAIVRALSRAVCVLGIIP